MELLFLGILVLLMIIALVSGFPVAFSLPGSSIIAIGLAALAGWMFADDPNAYFHEGGPVQWLSAGVTNLEAYIGMWNGTHLLRYRYLFLWALCCNVLKLRKIC